MTVGRRSLIKAPASPRPERGIAQIRVDVVFDQRDVRLAHHPDQSLAILLRHDVPERIVNGGNQNNRFDQAL